MKHYKFNFQDKKIEVSKKFLKKAEDPSTPECKELLALMAAYPGFSVAVKTIEMNGEKETYHGLTINKMRDHLINVYGKGSEQVQEFEARYEISKTMPSPYAVLKQWFLENFKEAYLSLNKAYDEKKAGKGKTPALTLTTTQEEAPAAVVNAPAANVTSLEKATKAATFQKQGA